MSCGHLGFPEVSDPGLRILKDPSSVPSWRVATFSYEGCFGVKFLFAMRGRGFQNVGVECSGSKLVDLAPIQSFRASDPIPFHLPEGAG